MGKSLIIKGADFSANGWRETFLSRMSLFGTGIGYGVNVNGYKARICAFCLKYQNEIPLKITAPAIADEYDYSKTELETLLAGYTYVPINGTLNINIVCKGNYKVTVNTINADGELISLGTASTSINETFSDATTAYLSIVFSKGDSIEPWSNSIEDVATKFEVSEVV